MKAWLVMFLAMVLCIGRGPREDRTTGPGRCGGPSKEGAPMNDSEMVKKAILVGYIEGVHGNQDQKTVQAGFHTDFAMIVPEESGGIRMVSVDAWLDFIENTAKVQNPSLWNSETTCRFDYVDVTDHAASVKIRVFKGEKHFSTDYLLLYRFRDGWKVVSKIFKLW